MYKKYSYKKIVDFISRYKGKAEYIKVGMSEDWDWTRSRVWSKYGFRIYASEDEAKKLEDEFAPYRTIGDCVHIAGIIKSEWATPTAIAYDKDGEVIAEEEVYEEEV